MFCCSAVLCCSAVSYLGRSSIVMYVSIWSVRATNALRKCFYKASFVSVTLIFVWRQKTYSLQHFVLFFCFIRSGYLSCQRFFSPSLTPAGVSSLLFHFLSLFLRTTNILYIHSFAGFSGLSVNQLLLNLKSNFRLNIFSLVSGDWIILLMLNIRTGNRNRQTF